VETAKERGIIWCLKKMLFIQTFTQKNKFKSRSIDCERTVNNVSQESPSGYANDERQI